jgi:hypothetical protein
VVCSSRSAEFHFAPPDRYRANLKAIIETNRMRFPAASILIVSQYRVLSHDHHNLLGLAPICIHRIGARGGKCHYQSEIWTSRNCGVWCGRLSRIAY